MVILRLETGKQSGKSTKCFPTKKEPSLGVFETKCSTHGESSLDVTSESWDPQLRKDCMLTILLSHGWHHQTCEWVLHCRDCLYVQSEDL